MVLQYTPIIYKHPVFIIRTIRKGWGVVVETGTALNWPVHEDKQNKSYNVQRNKSVNWDPKSKQDRNKTGDRITDLSHEAKSLFRN
jgi:hypothetical protein